MDKKKIGRRIKEERKKAGFSQSELAEAIEVTVSTVSTIERGVRAPSLEVLVNILGALETSADLVLQDVLECGFKIRETELDNKLQNLSPEARERIFRVINVMADEESQQRTRKMQEGLYSKAQRSEIEKVRAVFSTYIQSSPYISIC